MGEEGRFLSYSDVILRPNTSLKQQETREARGVERRLRGESSKVEELTPEEERMLAKFLRELAMKVGALYFHEQHEQHSAVRSRIPSKLCKCVVLGSRVCTTGFVRLLQHKGFSTPEICCYIRTKPRVQERKQKRQHPGGDTKTKQNKTKHTCFFFAVFLTKNPTRNDG